MNPIWKENVSPVLITSFELMFIVIVNELSEFLTTAVKPAGGDVPVDIKDSIAVFTQFKGVIVQAEAGTVRRVESPI